MMLTRQKLLRDVLAVGTVSAIVLFQSISTSNAEEPRVDELPLDHFKCYSVKAADNEQQPVVVDLEDQFGIEKNVFGKMSLNPSMLCNPVEVTKKLYDGSGGELKFPIRHPEEHLVCYKLKFKQINKAVIVTNQFGKEQPLSTIKSKYLCVPSKKVIVQDDAQIDEVVLQQPDCSQVRCPLDHFKCYDVEHNHMPQVAEKARRSLYLEDQFLGGRGMGLNQRLLCNPVIKLHDGKEFPIHRPEEHLVCYNLLSGSVPKTVIVANQFGKQKLLVGRASHLCLPSEKYEVQSD
jgi:hypothetical protein